MFNNKCAEIFCNDLENYSIICTQCDFKTYVFHEFVLHYKEGHFPPVPIKCEQKDEIFNEAGEKLEENTQTDLPLHEEPIEEICNGDIVQIDLQVKSECDFEEYEVDDKFDNTSNSDSEDNVPLQTLLENPLDSLKHACPECGKTLCSRKALRTHVRRRHPGCKLPRLNAASNTTECRDCNKVYSSRKGLQRHRRECHSKKPKEDEQLQCTNCEKKFPTRERLGCHLRNVHKIKKNGKELKIYSCTQCDRVFNERYGLKRHELRHTGTKKFVCEEPGCNMSFFDTKGMNAHKRYVHIGIKRFVCEQCGFSTKTASALQIHIRFHTGERPYQCPICQKAFATSAAVAEHKVLHTAHTHRPHVCDVCGKTFARQKALYHHKPLHLGIKKFICKICGKAYAQQAGLSAHKRQHTMDNFGEPL